MEDLNGSRAALRLGVAAALGLEPAQSGGGVAARQDRKSVV